MRFRFTSFLFMITMFGYTQNLIKKDSTALIDSVIAKEKKPTDMKPDIFSLGIGSGLDYGGLAGINFTAYPQKNIALFAGGGIALAGFGYNAGLKFRYIKTTQKKVQFIPFVVGMYGYNTVIVVVNNTDYNKFFYGITAGIGFDTRFKKGYLSAALLVPVRGDDVDNYITELQNKHHISFQNDLLPVAFSIGYKFILN